MKETRGNGLVPEDDDRGKESTGNFPCIREFSAESLCCSLPMRFLTDRFLMRKKHH